MAVDLLRPSSSIRTGSRCPAGRWRSRRQIALPPSCSPSIATSIWQSRPSHARLELDTRNIDHVVAAMEAGIVGDVLALARSSPEGATPLEIYRDRKGVDHRILRAPSLEQWLDGGGRLPPGDDPVLLDVDLDCFTSPSDVDPRVVLPWTQSIVRDHLLPEGSSAFWDALLPRTVALTLAREPYHCGGLLGAGRLLAQVAPVLFGELLGSSFA
jgi:hypothetical protein